MRNQLASLSQNGAGRAPCRVFSQAVRLLVIVTTGKSASLLMKGQLRFLTQHGFEITVVGAADHHLRDVAAREGVKIVPLPMSRSISPLRDLWMLWKLWRLMCQVRPHIVNASTPKGGLLGMMAAACARVPVRIYTLRGLRLATTKGLRRHLLGAAEWLTSRCAHRVLCVSRSLADEYVAGGFVPREKISVLGHGSSNGVDVHALRPTAATTEWRRQFRQAHSITDDSLVIGFAGRLTRDKGIAELVQAFRSLQRRFSHVWLLLVGDFEPQDPIDDETRSYIRECRQIIHTDFVNNASDYYHAMDVFVLPSYREGLPNVVLEAQAAALPVVAFAATGTVDAIIDRETGCLVPVGDVRALTDALSAQLEDAQLRTQHGEAGRRRVANVFSRDTVWHLLLQEYWRLLGVRKPETAAASADVTQAA